MENEDESFLSSRRVGTNSWRRKRNCLL